MRAQPTVAARTAAAALTALLLTLVPVGAAASPAAAAWRTTQTTNATLSAATISQSIVLLRGAGTIAGSTYSIGGVLAGQAGYVDLVNDSTTAATLTLTYRLGSLVAGNAIRACSQPWAAGGTCPGASTTLAGGGLLSGATGAYATPTPVLPGGRLRLRVDAIGIGVLSSVTLTPALPRPGQDRTLG